MTSGSGCLPGGLLGRLRGLIRRSIALCELPLLIEDPDVLEERPPLLWGLCLDALQTALEDFCVLSMIVHGALPSSIYSFSCPYQQ